MPKHIIRHCETTAKLGVDIAKKIAANGVEINVDFVERACLLHDVLRVCDFRETIESVFHDSVSDEDRAKWKELKNRYPGLRHEAAAYELLKDEYPEIALAIKKHAYKSFLPITNNGRSCLWLLAEVLS